MNIPGLGPDAPKTVNALGGRQSASPFRLDLLPPHALLAVAEIMAHGAWEYGEDNYLAISQRENLNHALAHIYGYLMGDTQEGAPAEHLKRAACRILFALEVELAGGPVPAAAIEARLVAQGRPIGPLKAELGRDTGPPLESPLQSS